MNVDGRSIQTTMFSRPAAHRGAIVDGQTTSELQITLISTLSGLKALADEWNDLFARVGQPQQVFQTHGFAHEWSNHFLTTPAASPSSNRLAIVVARRAGCAVLIWPLVINSELGLRVLTGLGEPVAQYTDAVIDPSEDATSLLGLALAEIIRVHAPDLIRLRKVRADATITPLLADIATHRINPVQAPFVTLRAGGSPFEDRQTGKAKKNRRRLLRRLEEHGSVEFRSLGGDADAGRTIATGLAAKREWLKRRGLLSPAIANPRLDGFLQAVSTSASTATGCRLFALDVAGKTVALAMGFQCGGRLMLHLITQIEEVERFGAGILNLEAVLKRIEAEGLSALDLLPPRADYKEDWADGAVEVADHVLGLTAAGRVWSLAVDRLLKPRLKRTLEALPFALRRRLSIRALTP